MISERHDKVEQIHATKKEVPIDLSDIPKTKALYYDDYKTGKFSSKILLSKDDYVILEQSAFYPTSGGQLHDKGTLNGKDVMNVIKQDNIIIHIVPENDLIEGEFVEGIVDLDRRTQLAQLHTAAHIVNAAARTILGSHVNQAGAKKVLDKAHLDITHYKALTDTDTKKIEEEANKIVSKNIDITKSFMSRREAENRFGMNIYQGGAIPGNELRIVEIPDVDVECCAGTHLNNTSETGTIKILKSTKISDGIVRIEFVSGKSHDNIAGKNDDIVNELTKILGVSAKQIPARVEELFLLWKKAKKAKKKKKEMPDLTLKSTEESDGDILEEAAKIISTQVEHLPKTVQRFLNDLESYK